MAAAVLFQLGLLWFWPMRTYGGGLLELFSGIML